MSVVRSTLSTLALCVALPSLSHAQTTPFDDRMVQAPTLERPGPASLAGDLATFSTGARSLHAGAFELPMSLALPQDRAPLLANIEPTYRPGRGLSEWGMGWGQDLSIFRTRRLGEIDYTDDDELVSPWGLLERGEDGAFYIAGLSPAIRLEHEANGWIAVDPDGNRYTFDVAHSTAEGTHRWSLSEVQGVHGETTTLSWQANDTGRAFLTAVRWGYDRDEYELILAYQSTPMTYSDYRSGAGVELDRRVASVALRVRDADTGHMRERYRYDLSYQADPYGMASYLRRIDRVYASGESMPPVTYHYATLDDALDDARFTVNEPLQPYVRLAGSSALAPNVVSLTDIDEDGRADLEHFYSRVLVRQTDDNWRLEALPAKPPGSPTPCGRATSYTNRPRTLVRLRPTDDEPLVFNALQTSPGVTEVFACTRAGALLSHREYAGNWELGPKTRLVDLDNDRRPDLIRITAGAFDILRNVSDADSIAFEPLPRQLLASASVSDVWVHDMNGDGLGDLVGLHNSGLAVWHGRGRGRFGPARIVLPVLSESGLALTNIPQYRATFLDMNSDGLTDLLLSREGAFFLFMNRGNRLAERRLPVALQSTLAGEWSIPLIADMDGSGDTQLTIVKNRVPYTARLTTPDVGLLTRVDDGKGSTLHVRYGRPTATAGAADRAPLLAETTTRRAGRGELIARFDYAAPAVHSTTALLLGFGRVVETARGGTVDVSFRHHDDLPVELTQVIERDERIAGLERFEHTDFADATYRGVALRRRARTSTGWRDAAGNVGAAKTVEHIGYERGVCPTQTRATTLDGTLSTIETLSSPTALGNALHCLPAYSEVRARHTHTPAADFDYGLEFVRTAAGDAQELVQVGGSEHVVTQRIGYDAAGRITSIERPGYGTTAFEYDSAGRLVRATSPEGVTNAAEALASMTDQVTAMALTRGGAGHTTWFAYDGLERLAGEWDDLDGGSEASPLREFSYTYASAAGALATRRTRVRLGAAVQSEQLSLMAADGEPVAVGHRVGTQWTLEDIVERDDGGAAVRRWRADVLPGDASAPTMDDLIGGADLVGSEQNTVLAEVVEIARAFGVDVWGQTVRQLHIEAGRLVAVEVDGPGYERRFAMDDAGRRIAVADETTAVTSVSYDLLGRAIRVSLPSGDQHQVALDAFGRPAHIERDGVGSVAYQYDAHGRLARETWRDAAGATVRTLALTLDPVGRPIRIERSTPDGGVSDIAIGYDGRDARQGAMFDDQAGHVTQVEVGPYRRTAVYDAGGRLAEETTDLGDWRSVTRAVAYDASGRALRTVLTVRDAATDQVEHELTKETTLDANGRPAAIAIDGAHALDIGYDSGGRIASLTTADGASLDLDYDATTRALAGKRQTSTAGTISSAAWSLDSRGRVATEQLRAGATTQVLAYTRDAAGRVIEASAPGATSSYVYDADGLLLNAEDGAGARSFDRRRDDNEQVEVDGMGRIVRIDDTVFTYGPSGDMATAARDGVTAAFEYDERGQRVARYTNGVLDRGYVNGAVISDDHLVVPVHVNGLHVATVVDGVLVPANTDLRDTVFLDANGLNVASPYGVRAVSLADDEVAEAIDYVGSGRDPISGTIRMGVRDYAPALGQFTTHDPLYFVEPGRCADQPMDCNLFGYAGGDPLTYVDPSGRQSESGTEVEPLRVIGIREVVETFERYKDSPFNIDDVEVFDSLLERDWGAYRIEVPAADAPDIDWAEHFENLVHPPIPDHDQIGPRIYMTGEEIQAEMDTVMGSPFSAWVFVKSQEAGETRTESQAKAEDMNRVWKLLSKSRPVARGKALEKGPIKIEYGDGVK